MTPNICIHVHVYWCTSLVYIIGKYVIVYIKIKRFVRYSLNVFTFLLISTWDDEVIVILKISIHWWTAINKPEQNAWIGCGEKNYLSMIIQQSLSYIIWEIIGEFPTLTHRLQYSIDKLKEGVIACVFFWHWRNIWQLGLKLMFVMSHDLRSILTNPNIMF